MVIMMPEMDVPLVSIIIPIYKVEEYIVECVRSVINQKYSNIEVILVDDCGGDNSLSLALATLSGTSVAYKVVSHSHNRGLSAARNSAVDCASGKYLFFLDSDDIITPECISVLVAEAESSGADMVFGNYMELVEDKLMPGYATRKSSTKLEYNALRAYMNSCSPPMAWNRLLHKEWYISANVVFIEGILHEDEPWSLSLAIKAPTISYVNEITYHYRQRQGSIVNNGSRIENRTEGRLAHLQLACKEWDNCPKELNEEYCQWYNRTLWYYLSDTDKQCFNRKRYWLCQILKYAKVSDAAIVRRLTIREMRLFYMVRRIFPCFFAYKLACYVSGMKFRRILS